MVINISIPYRRLHILNRILFILILFTASAAVQAQQPVAAFTADNVSGCAPLTVQFTDQSTGAPTNWNWDFGNGQLLSAQNNSIVYTQPGIYTVQLVVRNANGINSITKTNYIEVKATPVVDFAVNKVSGCSNGSFHFTDQSAIPNGTITNWLWDFGDGQTGNSNSQDHIYSTAGVYNVSLTVGSSTGCNATTTKYNFIQVVPGVKADFNNSTPVSCSAPFQVLYTNLSTGDGTLTYRWSLGNGSSTAVSPTRNYNNAADYTIKLVTKSSFGCIDSVSKTISIKKVTTDISFSNACLSQSTTFQNTSGDQPVASQWTFGDGSQSADLNPSYTYPSTGSFVVKLVNTYAACRDSVSKSITIQNNPVPNFTAGNTSSCTAPLSVNFQNNNASATAWSWDFGDGTPAGTTKNPSHQYTSPGKYSVTLTVTTAGGCTGTITKADFVNIAEPEVNVSNAPAGGCAPFVFSPAALITSADGIRSYSWNFGEGPLSSNPTPTHNYNTPGSYVLSLTITTNGGCQKTFTSAVNVGTTASAVDFTAASLIVCPYIGDQFNATSSTPGLTWQWNFGDGETANTQNPLHAFKDTGDFNITVNAINNGCSTPLTKTKYIKVLAPIARFTFNVDCNTGTKVKFNNTTVKNAASGNLTYSWDFGDPSITGQVNDVSPEVFFSGPGSYTVKLSVSSDNNSCTNIYTKQVVITSPGADFTIDKTEVCKDAMFTLTSTSDPANVTSYAWSIGTNASVTAGAVYSTSVTASNIYDVKLSLTDINGCPHENTRPLLLTVSGPSADFNTPPVHCGNDTINFTDNSTSAKPVTSWQWDYGDGNSQSFTAGPFNHKYADTGVYNISLTVTDAAGCPNTINKTAALTISNPVAFFRKDSVVWCPGTPILFSDSSTGNNLNYTWNFGDGIISADKDPVHTYSSADSSYSIKLKITDYAGCQDSLTRDKYIQVTSPKASFDIKTRSGICTPLIEEFKLTGTGYQSVSWNFGDATPLSGELNPQHAYTRFANYTPTLTLFGNGGCSATASGEINITDPSTAQLIYNAPETCNSLSVSFDVKPPPGINFALYFGDGTADSTQNISITHNYSSPAFYTPYLLLKDSSGCTENVNGQTEIRIIGADPIFGTNPTERCDPGTVNFTNYTFSNDPVSSYKWDFGDNTSDRSINPAHLYQLPGTYNPKLTVTTQRGCSSTFSDTIKIYRSPAVDILSNDTVCLNAAVKFTTSILPSDTAVSYVWSFTDGDHSTDPEPIKTFKTEGSIVVNLQTSIPFGCSATTSKPVNISPLPIVNPIPDQNILVGQTVIIPATYSEKVTTYKWTPAITLDCSDCPTPKATPKNNTVYKVIATDRYGCEANGEVTVIVTCSNNNFFIPNTFSPNNDGVNDNFYPRGTGLVRVGALRIFNRWGEMVFEKKDFAANDAKSGWDGTFKGKPAISDVYIYKIEVICENSQVIPFQGNVFLLR